MAKNVTIVWTLPTTREGGGALNENDIQHVLPAMSADGGANFTALAPVTPGEIQQVFVPDLEVGEWIFRFIVVDTDGQSSDVHEEPVEVLDDSPPNPISDVTVTID